MNFAARGAQLGVLGRVKIVWSGVVGEGVRLDLSGVLLDPVLATWEDDVGVRVVL